MSKDNRMSFSYPEKMKDKLTELAKKDNRKLQGYIKIIIDNHVEILKGGANGQMRTTIPKR